MTRQPITFDKELAVAIGLDNAIVLQQIAYWSKIKRRKVYNSYADWLKLLPWMSLSGIRRAIKFLETKGLVIGTVDSASGNKKCYEINAKHTLCSNWTTPMLKKNRPLLTVSKKPVQNEQEIQAPKESQEERKYKKKVSHQNDQQTLVIGEYTQLHDFFKFKRGGKSKPNTANLPNFLHWRKTYDLLDMKFAVACIEFDPYWAEKNITLDILLRQKTPSQEPCDRIGQFLDLKADQFVAYKALAQDYRLLRDWWKNKPVLPKEEAIKIIMALRTFKFETEEKEYITRVKEAAHVCPQSTV